MLRDHRLQLFRSEEGEAEEAVVGTTEAGEEGEEESTKLVGEGDAEEWETVPRRLARVPTSAVAPASWQYSV